MHEIFVGFHKPYFRNLEGRIDYRGWVGHCEAWGQTVDGTWLFLDPQGKGFFTLVTHHHDEVLAQLQARIDLCDSILKVAPVTPNFRFPLHGPMTCASICGALVGIRALLPSTLRRKLLASGAEVIHAAQREPEGPSRAGT